LRAEGERVAFPEEGNRRIIARIASLLFAPTERDRLDLLQENIDEQRVVLSGDTRVDSLLWCAEQRSPETERILSTAPNARKLVVMLERETPSVVRATVAAANRVLDELVNLELIWMVRAKSTEELINQALVQHAPARVIPHQRYAVLVQLLNASTLILSDSIRMQQEAPLLGRPVLVPRIETDRPAEQALPGCVIGAGSEAIYKHCHTLLGSEAALEQLRTQRSALDDGHASRRVIEQLEAFYGQNHSSPFMRSWPPLASDDDLNWPGETRELSPVSIAPTSTH